MMGLNINVVKPEVIFDFCAGSYTGFGEFRKRLAKLVKIDLLKMSGYHGNRIWTSKCPFRELLDHSDCDGTLDINACRELLADFNNVSFQQRIEEESVDFQDSVTNWIRALIEVVIDIDDENTYIEFS